VIVPERVGASAIPAASSAATIALAVNAMPAKLVPANRRSRWIAMNFERAYPGIGDIRCASRRIPQSEITLLKAAWPKGGLRSHSSNT
jgi:hypothetical protein